MYYIDVDNNVCIVAHIRITVVRIGEENQSNSIRSQIRKQGKEGNGIGNKKEHNKEKERQNERNDVVITI